MGSGYLAIPIAAYVFLVFNCWDFGRKWLQKKLQKKATSPLRQIYTRNLCRSLGDSSHRTNIFKASNQELLKIAEHLYGHALRKEPGLPSLVCRPCERRLKHATDF